MAATENQELDLENWLNRATNPINKEEDWEYIMGFCDQINNELEGPQIACALIAHKIQSPQDREALLALSTLEACVKNCGRRFHQEIGKFRFLNEIIKVISPKYYGTRTSDKVKRRCIELLYSWSQGLVQETKIKEAYTMLKSQGVITEDPSYMDKTLEVDAPARAKHAVFENDEKSKLLARLLKSRSPEDLQAANRLIKNMVKEDNDRMDKVSRRFNEIEKISTNTKLLSEMMSHFSDDSSEADREMMKDLFDQLEKNRPILFRLASETDEKDNDGINDILKMNDEMMKVMNQYKHLVEKVPDSQKLDHGSLLDLEVSPEKILTNPSTTTGSTAILQEQLSAFGLDDITVTTQIATSVTQVPNVFSNFQQFQTAPAVNSGMIQGQVPMFQPNAMFQVPNQQQANFANLFANSGLPANITPPVRPTGPLPAPAKPTQPNMHSMGDLSTLGKSWLSQSKPASVVPQSATQSAKSSTTNAPTASLLDDLMLPASPPTAHSQTSNIPFISPQPPQQMPLQQTTVPASIFLPPQTNASASMPFSTQAPVQSSTSLDNLIQPNLQTNISLIESPSSVPQLQSPIKQVELAATTMSSPAAVPSLTQSPTTVSLADINVTLESIKPAAVDPLNAYDKNNIKILIYFGNKSDSPREDITVMVVSITSTCSTPVMGVTFQAAVPKVMKVKLQPPTATDLPAYNPILPQTAITQVMLLANPSKERVRLKFKLKYSTESGEVTDFGEVDDFSKLH